MRYGAILILIA